VLPFCRNSNCVEDRVENTVVLLNHHEAQIFFRLNIHRKRAHGEKTRKRARSACLPICRPWLQPLYRQPGTSDRLFCLWLITGAHGGYIADATRNFALASLLSDMQEAHTWILELGCEIDTMLVPGTECRKICDHAFAKAEDCSFGNTFMGIGDNHLRFIGHGVGLELDELPVLSWKSRYRLKPSMVLPIEPKVFSPDRGGVGIENTYLITETGSEKLTPYREDIMICSEKEPTISALQDRNRNSIPSKNRSR
jgi:hypothetical protein